MVLEGVQRLRVCWILIFEDLTDSVKEPYFELKRNEICERSNLQKALL